MTGTSDGPYRVSCDLPDPADGIAVWSTGKNRIDEHGEGDDIASPTYDQRR